MAKVVYLKQTNKKKRIYFTLPTYFSTYARPAGRLAATTAMMQIKTKSMNNATKSKIILTQSILKKFFDIPLHNINMCIMESKIPAQWEKFYLKDVSFVNLMMRRIYNVLIVANPYDAFMLEDDGRIEEKIYNEYMLLGLRYPPTFTQVSTIEEAEKMLHTTNIDLVICMPGNADNDAFAVARAIKHKFPHMHCIVLTPFSHGITKRMQHEDLSIFDYVFCWLGNTNLILSIIKLIEDKMNLDHDIHEAGVQMILVVEDSIRFYSSILPNLYNYILLQSQRFSTEALNRHAATMRMRGRPKVVLARTYEEAMAMYERYSDNVLGVISDARFPIHGEKDPEAGIKLFREIRSRNEYVPLIMESSESSNRAKAEAEGFRFVDKNSKKMSLDLRRLMEEHMGFGDFVFRDPRSHEEILRIHSLKELQDNIFKIPNDSMLYHISRNHMSRWLSARAIFPVSAFLKDVTWNKLQDVDAHRRLVVFEQTCHLKQHTHAAGTVVGTHHRFAAVVGVGIAVGPRTTVPMSHQQHTPFLFRIKLTHDVARVQQSAVKSLQVGALLSHRCAALPQPRGNPVAALRMGIGVWHTLPKRTLARHKRIGAVGVERDFLCLIGCLLRGVSGSLARTSCHRHNAASHQSDCIFAFVHICLKICRMQN